MIFHAMFSNTITAPDFCAIIRPKFVPSCAYYFSILFGPIMVLHANVFKYYTLDFCSTSGRNLSCIRDRRECKIQALEINLALHFQPDGCPSNRHYLCLGKILGHAADSVSKCETFLSHLFCCIETQEILL